MTAALSGPPLPRYLLPSLFCNESRPQWVSRVETHRRIGFTSRPDFSDRRAIRTTYGSDTTATGEYFQSTAIWSEATSHHGI